MSIQLSEKNYNELSALIDKYTEIGVIWDCGNDSTCIDFSCGELDMHYTKPDSLGEELFDAMVAAYDLPNATGGYHIQSNSLIIYKDDNNDICFSGSYVELDPETKDSYFPFDRKNKEDLSFLKKAEAEIADIIGDREYNIPDITLIFSNSWGGLSLDHDVRTGQVFTDSEIRAVFGHKNNIEIDLEDALYDIVTPIIDKKVNVSWEWHSADWEIYLTFKDKKLSEVEIESIDFGIERAINHEILEIIEKEKDV